MVVYTVHAFRYGDREMHGYIVGVYGRKTAALKAADLEREWRGGNKYHCEVRKFRVLKTPGHSQDRDGEVILPLERSDFWPLRQNPGNKKAPEGAEDSK